MTPSITDEIHKAEQDLKEAMLHSDVAALDKLLDSRLIFTNHLGQVMSKEDDLQGHRSGTLRIDDIVLSEQHLAMHGETAIVSILANISGCFNGQASQNTLRFTRVWSRTQDQVWRVISGHACLLQ